MGIFDFFKNKNKRKNIKSNVSELFEQIGFSGYKRFIFLKGGHLVSVEDKIGEYRNMYPSAFSGTELKSAAAGDWTVINIPEQFNNRFEFHNFVFWFLGYPPEDSNYADNVIGLALSEDESGLSYFIYLDKEISSEVDRSEEMAGMFENGESFVLNIPEDKVKTLSNPYVSAFYDFFALNGIDIDSVKSGKLNFKKVEL